MDDNYLLNGSTIEEELIDFYACTGNLSIYEDWVDLAGKNADSNSSLLVHSKLKESFFKLFTKQKIKENVRGIILLTASSSTNGTNITIYATITTTIANYFVIIVAKGKI
nr:7759_t:CDS:2 [Entrophospora candida]